VVVIGAERIRSFGMGANEMADLVHQHAARQRRPPANQRGGVNVQPPAAVHGEGAKPFGRNRLG